MKFIVRSLIMRKRISRYMLQRVFVSVGNREYGIHAKEIFTTKNRLVRPSRELPAADWSANAHDLGAANGTGITVSAANANQEAKERSLRLRSRRALQARLAKRSRSIRIIGRVAFAV